VTLSEIGRVMDLLRTNYPQSFKSYEGNQMDILISLWEKAFRNVPAVWVEAAVLHFINEDPTPYAPVIGQITTYIKSQVSSLNADKEWDFIVYLVRDVDEGYYNKLMSHEITCKLVSPSDIRAYKEDNRRMEMDRTRFIRRYNEEKERLEREAFRTGNFSMIASSEQLKRLGVKKTLELE